MVADSAVDRMKPIEKAKKRARKQTATQVTKKLKASQKKIVTKKKTKDTTVRAVAEEETPPLQGDVNTEFNEMGTAVFVDQVPKMEKLIQPNADTKQAVLALHKQPMRPQTENRKVKTTVHGVLKPRVLSKCEQKSYCPETLKRLQKPIQPPARMGYLSFLDRKAEFLI